MSIIYIFLLLLTVLLVILSGWFFLLYKMVSKPKFLFFHWFVAILIFTVSGWYGIKRYEADNIIKQFEATKSYTVNGLRNPLGLEDMKSFYKIKLAQDYGEAESGRSLGYIAIYQVSNFVANAVLKTQGKYLSITDIPAFGKHWIIDSKHPDISCYPNKSNYHWQPISQAPQILLQHTNLTEKDVFQTIDKYLNLDVLDSSFYKFSRVYPVIFGGTKNIAHNLSKQTVVYPEIQRGNLYIHFFDPINRLYIVTLQIDAVKFNCNAN